MDESKVGASSPFFLLMDESKVGASEGIQPPPWSKSKFTMACTA
jgi:hypothetical protein